MVGANADGGGGTMNMIITPIHDCNACKGGGMLPGDSVPYGSTTAQLPDDYCDCVIEQLPDDSEDYDIIIRLDDKVAERWEAAAKAEAEFLARTEDEQC
jgi:hypothetical protein